MSLAAADPESQRDVALLQELLHKREHHLAELIDEVVFAEQERFKAVQEAHTVRELATHLESAFDKLLQYHITMHKEVLLPSLVASVQAEEKVSRRYSTAQRADLPYNNKNNNDGSDAASPSNDFLNDLLNDPHLSRETKQLLHAAMEQRNGPAEDALVQQQPSSQAEGSSVTLHATHRAIALSDSLLRSQETLTRLLRSIQDQAEEMIGRSASRTGDSPPPTSPSAVKARADPNMMYTPSQRFAAASKRRTSDVTPVAPFRLENLHQHSDRAREIGEGLRRVDEERDALQSQLQEREHAATTSATVAQSEKAAWAKERVQLKQELAHTQQRVLEEQARCRELKKQVAQLDAIVAASPVPAKPTPCRRCEKMRKELRGKSLDYHAAKSAWKEEERRLQGEIASLQRQAAAAAAAAAAQNFGSPPAPPAAGVMPAAASTTDPSRYPAGPSSERKIGQLEATVASMKADLQIMEMRMTIMQDEREAERRRILATHEHERERLRRERDECQRIIDKMARELQGLSRSVTAAPPPAITSTAS